MAILLKIYAKCIDGQDDIAKRRIEEPSASPAKMRPPSQGRRAAMTDRPKGTWA